MHAINIIIVILIIYLICIFVLDIIKEKNRHNEQIKNIQATIEIGKKAWEMQDEEKDAIIIKQALEIYELRLWKQRVIKRFEKLKLKDIFNDGGL